MNSQHASPVARKLNAFALTAAAVLTVGGAALVGCSGRPTLLPSDDPTLQKTSTEFAVDAAKRFPYKADAPRGGDAHGRAEIGYELNRIELANLSDHDWTDVEVWINQGYVLHLTLLKKGEDRTLPLQMFFDDSGHYYPTSGGNRIIKKIELYAGGKMYDVAVQTAD